MAMEVMDMSVISDMVDMVDIKNLLQTFSPTDLTHHQKYAAMYNSSCFV